MPETFDHHAAQEQMMAAIEAEDVGDANDVAEAIAETPDVDVPDPELPEVEADPAPEGVIADPYEQYGGEDTVKNAMIVANALKTEAGIRQLTARGLQTLGYSATDIEAFLASQAAQSVGVPGEPEQADPWNGLEDDDVLTVAQAKQLQADIAAQIAASQQPFLEQQAEAQQAATTYAVDAALVRAIGDPTAADPNSTVDPKLADVILRVANSLVPEGQSVTPQQAALYIEQAHASVVGALGDQLTAKVEAKRAVKASLPTKTGGQGAGADKPTEPQNTREADLAFFALMDLPAPPR